MLILSVCARERQIAKALGLSSRKSRWALLCLGVAPSRPVSYGGHSPRQPRGSEICALSWRTSLPPAISCPAPTAPGAHCRAKRRPWGPWVAPRADGQRRLRPLGILLFPYELGPQPREAELRNRGREKTRRAKRNKLASRVDFVSFQAWGGRVRQVLSEVPQGRKGVGLRAGPPAREVPS